MSNLSLSLRRDMLRLYWDGKLGYLSASTGDQEMSAGRLPTGIRVREDGVAVNTTAVEFYSMPLGEVTQIRLWSAPTGGEVLVTADLPEPVPVQRGFVLRVEPESFQFEVLGNA